MRLLDMQKEAKCQKQQSYEMVEMVAAFLVFKRGYSVKHVEFRGISFQKYTDSTHLHTNVRNYSAPISTGSKTDSKKRVAGFASILL